MRRSPAARSHRTPCGCCPSPPSRRSTFFMMLLAALWLNELTQVLGCADGEFLASCFRPQDVLLGIGVVVVVALAATAGGLIFRGWRRGLVAIEVGWCLLLTWYGWFSMESPLRPHELSEQSEGPSGGRFVSYLPRIAIYTVIALVGLYPLIRQRLGSERFRRGKMLETGARAMSILGALLLLGSSGLSSLLELVNPEVTRRSTCHFFGGC